MLANLLILVSGMVLPSFNQWESRRYLYIGRSGNTSYAVAGQPKSRGRPDTGLAAQNQLAAVQLDQRLRNWQSETRTLMFSGQVICDLFERLENSFDLLGGDADSRISDRQHQIPAFVEH